MSKAMSFRSQQTGCIKTLSALLNSALEPHSDILDFVIYHSSDEIQEFATFHWG